MRLISTDLQLLLFAMFLISYLMVIIPAAMIVAMRTPVISPAPPRAKTTIGLGHNVRRIY